MPHLYLAISAVFLMLLLVVIFVAQNSGPVPIKFIVWHGHLALGLALLLSAVIGGLLVVLLSALRIIQLRRRDPSQQRRPSLRLRRPVKRVGTSPSVRDDVGNEATSASDR